MDIYITITDELAYIIDQSPTGDLAFISTATGSPMKKESFGNWFRKACKAAGIDKSAHGLRKTAATLLAEAGGTGKELMAAFGWKSERMAAFYTLEADRKRLSLRASTKRMDDKSAIIQLKKIEIS